MIYRYNIKEGEGQEGSGRASARAFAKFVASCGVGFWTGMMRGALPFPSLASRGKRLNVSLGETV